MSWTLNEAQEILNLWIAAEKAVASGQSYSIGGRSLTRADARVITDKIQFWRREVERLKDGGGAGPTIGRMVPLDG